MAAGRVAAGRRAPGAGDTAVLRPGIFLCLDSARNLISGVDVFAQKCPFAVFDR